jgi:hypothetical protein
MKPGGFALSIFEKRLKKKPKSSSFMDLDEDEGMENEDGEEENDEMAGCEAAVKKFFETGQAGDYTAAAKFLKRAIDLA